MRVKIFVLLFVVFIAIIGTTNLSIAQEPYTGPYKINQTVCVMGYGSRFTEEGYKIFEVFGTDKILYAEQPQWTSWWFYWVERRQVWVVEYDVYPKNHCTNQ